MKKQVMVDYTKCNRKYKQFGKFGTHQRICMCLTDNLQCMYDDIKCDAKTLKQEEEIKNGKAIVTYEIALKLQELGFDEECLATYRERNLTQYPYEKDVDGNVHFITIKNSQVVGLVANTISAPLWQQVIDWFLTKHCLLITITSQSQESWQWHIQFPHDSLDKMWEEDFYAPEKAREAAILKAIELIKFTTNSPKYEK